MSRRATVRRETVRFDSRTVRTMARAHKHQFRSGPTNEALAIDQRVSAFGWFSLPAQCEFVPEEVQDGVAILSINGPLEHHSSWIWTSYEEIAKQVDAALGDGNVRAVVLKIDSPGGIAAGMDEMHKRLRRMMKRSGKAIYAYVDEQACSAAYHLASACSEIWLPKSAEVGSVGVILCTVDETTALDKAGIKVRYVVTGKRKADLHAGQPVDDEVLEVAQQKVDYLGDMFFAAVGKAREMDPSDVQALEAAVFSGQEAVDVGLADGVSSWEAFVALVRRSASGTVAATGTDERSSSRSHGEAKAMTKILKLQKAANDAKAAFQAATKAFALKPGDKKLEATARAAYEAKQTADKALAVATKTAKKTTVKHLKHEEKEVVHDDEEEEEEEEEEEAEESTGASTGASVASTGASSTGGSSTGASSTGSTGEEEEEEEEEKAAAKTYVAATGLYSSSRLLRMCRQITGERSIRAVFGAMDAIGQRLAKADKVEARVTKLETARKSEKVERMLATAKADGRVTRAEMDSLRAKGTSDPKWLKGYLAQKPKAVRTTDDAFEPRADGDGNPVGLISSEQQELVMKATAGMSDEQRADFIAKMTSASAKNKAKKTRH